MSQAQLLPTASPSASLPPLTYKGLPVVTTEMLAKAYGCPTKNIQDNFLNNRGRFTEGKHFYTLANGELKEFRAEICDPKFSGCKISTKARNLTLWLERGAARHAKMLNTDQAWDVFEMLEETFFRVVKPAERPRIRCTHREMLPLESVVTAWRERSGLRRKDALAKVRTQFGLRCYDRPPRDMLADIVKWVDSQNRPAARTLPKEPDLSNLPNARQLLRDIDQAIMVLAPTENWTHLMVREELRREAAPGTTHAVNMHVNATWYALGLARSSLMAAVALGKMG